MKIKLENVEPAQIEARSFEIITEELRAFRRFPELNLSKRCIHTSADFDYAKIFAFRDHVVSLAIDAIKKRRVHCDRYADGQGRH